MSKTQYILMLNVLVYTVTTGFYGVNIWIISCGCQWQRKSTNWYRKTELIKMQLIVRSEVLQRYLWRYYCTLTLYHVIGFMFWTFRRRYSLRTVCNISEGLIQLLYVLRDCHVRSAWNAVDDIPLRLRSRWK